MKKIITLVFMSAVLALTSCNDFLDKYPKYGVDPESEVTNEIAVALTTACYKTLQSSNMYNQRIWLSLIHIFINFPEVTPVAFCSFPIAISTSFCFSGRREKIS